MVRGLVLVVLSYAMTAGGICQAQSSSRDDDFRRRTGSRATQALQGSGGSASSGDARAQEFGPRRGSFQPRGVASKNPKSKKSKPRFVEIEISGNLQGQVGVTQEWIEVLNQVGADRVRARSGKDNTATSGIEEIEGPSSTTIIVQGALTTSRKLLLAGGTYTLRDRAKIAKFVQELKDDGVDVTFGDKLAFGLTAEQLVDVNSKLGSVVKVKTKGASAGALVGRLMRETDVEFVISPGARKMLGSTETVPDELTGLTTGTTLAAAIRPLGLVMRPNRKQGETVKLQLLQTSEAGEVWPVGWPIEESIVKVVPQMFEKTKLQINQVPLQTVLNALESRLKIPFLYDHNAIARAEIETTTAKVTLNNEKIGYMVALRKMLGQTRPRLIPELRMDEAGKPFLWISTR